jgi:outer membrane protein TolC
LVKAFKLKAEYLSVHQKIKREEIKLVYAKNQRWPQLDMKASYGLNGLATDPGGSWDEVQSGDYDTWSVGLELRIPLGGDRKSRSELGATRQLKRQALLELKAVEVALANTVDTAIRSVQNSLDQLKHYSDVVDFNKRLLDAEIARFKAGKSNSRLLLEKEGDLHRAEEARLDSLAKYQNANTELALAEGSLLLKYGIEIMKVDL